MFSTSATVSARRAAVLGACAALALTAVPLHAAEAAPNRLGSITGLTVEVTKPAAFAVAADWNDLRGATAYRVTLTTNAGSVTTETTASDATFSRNGLVSNEQVTVTVRGMKETRPRLSKPTSVSVVVPDLVPPTGSYAVSVRDNSGDATVTQLAVGDDVTAGADIRRVIDWGDGSTPEPFTGSSMNHTYVEGPRVYRPTVTLTDAAGNTSVVEVGAAPVRDAQPPAGKFGVTAPTATTWAAWTPVTLTQQELSDDASAAGDITRVVSWGDGSTTRWTIDGALTHVYAKAGTYHPSVTITDEANKSTVVRSADVLVTADTAAPRAQVTRPAKRTSVRSWKVVRGKAIDAGTGVRRVDVRLVQKRERGWFGYRSTSGRWVKAATKARAVRRAQAATRVPVDGRWSVRVKGLKKGTLVVKVRSVDNVGNAARPVLRKQSLTRR